MRDNTRFLPVCHNSLFVPLGFLLYSMLTGRDFLGEAGVVGGSRFYDGEGHCWGTHANVSLRNLYTQPDVIKYLGQTNGKIQRGKNGGLS